MDNKYIEEMAQLKADFQLNIDTINESLAQAIYMLDSLEVPNAIGEKVYFGDIRNHDKAKAIYRYSDNVRIGIFGIKENVIRTNYLEYGVIFMKIHNIYKAIAFDNQNQMPELFLELCQSFCIIPTEKANMRDKRYNIQL